MTTSCAYLSPTQGNLLQIKEKLVASPDTLEEIGKRLRRMRFAFGGADAGEFAARFGVKRTTWLSYEAGARWLQPDTAVQLCAQFGVTTDWIYRGIEHTLPVHVLERLQAMPVDQLPPKRTVRSKQLN